MCLRSCYVNFKLRRGRTEFCKFQRSTHSWHEFWRDIYSEQVPNSSSSFWSQFFHVINENIDGGILVSILCVLIWFLLVTFHFSPVFKMLNMHSVLCSRIHSGWIWLNIQSAVDAMKILFISMIRSAMLDTDASNNRF